MNAFPLESLLIFITLSLSSIELSATHKFYAVEKDNREKLTSTAKFIHFWIKEMMNGHRVGHLVTISSPSS